MPPLPRGRCPYCGTDVALRKGSLIREHKDHRHPLHKIGEIDRVPACPGSGRVAGIVKTGSDGSVSQ